MSGFGWAGAAAGAEHAIETKQKRDLDLQQALADAAYKQSLIQAEQSRQAQVTQQMQLQRDQFGLTQKRFDADQQRQGEQDRAKTNDRGVERMVGEYIRTNGITPQNRGQIVGTLVEAGHIPSTAQMLNDPEAESAQREKELGLQHQNRLGEIAAQGSETRRTQAARPASSAAASEWIIRNGTPMQIPKGSAQPGDKPYNATTDRMQSAGATTSPYEVERATRTVQAVQSIKSKVGMGTAGMGGAILSHVPGTSATDLRSELDTLKANIAFGELAAMRQASKTGGALGQISDAEERLLSSTLGATDPNQSPQHLREQLQKVEDSLRRWYRAQGIELPGGGPQVGETRSINGQPARWDGHGWLPAGAH